MHFGHRSIFCSIFFIPLLNWSLKDDEMSPRSNDVLEIINIG